MSAIPVGGRRPSAMAYVKDVMASDVQVWVNEHGASVDFVLNGAVRVGVLHPYGSDPEQQLLMLVSIGDTIREQARETLAALRAAEAES